MTSDNLNYSTDSANFRSNTTYRKRKVDASDFEDKLQNKVFLTEAILIKSMTKLSLDLSENKSPTKPEDVHDDEEKNNNQNETEKLLQRDSQVELHKLLKDNLRKDDLQDSFMNKIWDGERRKISLQIVPYMPIHPAQLNNNNHNNTKMDEKEKEAETKSSSPIIVDQAKKENDDNLFKRPLQRTPYKVEEPPESTVRRTPKMKRSYSQSVRYNSNLSVTELKDDTNNFTFYPAQSDYFVTEPVTPIVIASSSSSTNSTLLSTRPTVQISEYFDFPSSFSSQKNISKSFEQNDIDMESNVLSDVCDKMDDNI